ncbi:MAG: peptidylprolyl isomerase [Bacteroidota bacterium]
MYRIIFITVLLLFSLSDFNIKAQNDSLIDNVIAVVGNQIILKSEVEEQLLQMQARGMSGEGDQKCKIFEQLLFQKLLVVQAQIDSIEVTSKQVDTEIEGRLQTFIQQIGGPKELEAYFGKSILEIKEDFKPIVREQLLAQKMQSEITLDVKITPSEVKNFYKSIPKDSLPIINANYEIAHIVIQPKISNEQKEAVKNKLNALRERIVKGESFSTLAVLYSDDKSSAKNGGRLGFVNKSDLVKEFSSVAFSLEKDEVSEIVETEFGYHVIQMIEKRGNQIDVRHILLIPQIASTAKYKAKEKLDSITKYIRLDSITFGQAALKFSTDEDTRKNEGLMINPYTGTSKFEIKQIDPATNYALKKLDVGQISDPFEAQNQKGKTVYKIIYKKSETKPHTINLKEDYQQVQDMALANKKDLVVKAWVKKIQKETYVKIPGNFSKCPFDFQGWIK